MEIRTRAIAFTEQLGFSKLFTDYLRFGEFFRNRFPGNNLCTDGAHLSRIAEQYRYRDRIAEAVRNSMRGIELTAKQSDRLANLADRRSLAVVTGQQPGFLGGPLYTYFKAATTVAFARRMSSRFPSFDFVPIFWVEDNDHDSREASVSYVFTKESSIIAADAAFGEHPVGISVADRKFAAGITDLLEEILGELPFGDFKTELESVLRNSISAGKGWSESFVGILNAVFAESGLLFVRSSVLRSMGFFDEAARSELTNCGTEKSSDTLVGTANSYLSQSGYHIQAKSKVPNLFAHIGGSRQKITFADGQFRIGDELYSLSELLSLSKRTPGLFSPNVLLRPVFQDLSLPNIAYVGGPAEIGYAAQIKELYAAFGVEMPAFLSRHSATLVLPKVAMAAEKSSMMPEELFVRRAELEARLSSSLMGEVFGTEFAQAESSLAEAFGILAKAFEEKKMGLDAAVKSHERAAAQQLEHLQKKAIAVMKKSSESGVRRMLGAQAFIFPEDTLQERMLTVANIVPQVGWDGFRELLSMITENESLSHIVVNIDKAG